MSSIWSENLTDAYVYNDQTGYEDKTWSNFNLSNYHHINGTGFNYQLGVIVKPIQELRLGLSFHTPTFYKLTETYNSGKLSYASGCQQGYAETYDGTPTYNNVNFESPWKVMVSAAGVIGSSLIVSADYEWQGYKNMQYTTASYDSYWYDDYYNSWDYPWYSKGNKVPFKTPASYVETPINSANSSIQEIYRNTNTIRIGAEYRIIPEFSVRVGYSFVSSPVSSKAKDCLTEIPTTGTMTNYRLDNSTNYATCGVGYRNKGFYADLAYVYKHMTSTYYPFSPDPANIGQTLLSVTPKSNLTFDNSQLVLSVGYKF
jgi:long-subunit fatty acid transport protein